MFGRLREISQLDGDKVFASLNHGQHTPHQHQTRTSEIAC
jgi:hypothetical protein